MEFLTATYQMICESNVNNMIEAAQRQLVYPFRYRSNIKKLEELAQRLEDEKSYVGRAVEAAARNLEMIPPEVLAWLTSVEKTSTQIRTFFDDEEQAKFDCCNGWCPNLMTRYQFSKEAYGMVLHVSDLLRTGNFTHVSYRAPIQGIGTEMFNKGYEAFESRRSIFEGIMEALIDENINMIGVYGMGGVGKTSLVKEVATQAMKIDLFNEMVMVVVSQIPDHENIQRDIAEELGLKLEQKNNFVRSHQIRMRLKQEKKTLVIIDDIWERLDLDALGICFGDDQKGCKILVTSRSRDVICNAMGIKTNFHVGILCDDEATYLFERIVGVSIGNSNFQTTMAEVIEQCAGLPIAIAIVASALKNKELCVWKDALQYLKDAIPTDIEGMHKKVYMSIKLSYDFLGSKETKSLFLLCSMFGDDSDINVKILEGYGLHLGLFHNIRNMEQAGNRVLSLVEKLKACSLLLDGSYTGTVKMHDVIRDVAIYIAKENFHFRKWPKKKAMIWANQDEGCSNNVHYPGSPKERGVTNNECFQSFGSRQGILMNVMSMLATDSTQNIGVCGIRGVGKTMLVKEIARRAMKDNLFDMVVMVDASQNTGLKMIQKEIAGKLDLPSDRLKVEKNILVIIDDVSEAFDLNAIKSFLEDHRMRCKVLTTSRYKDIFSDMDVASIFLISSLNHYEAVCMFKIVVGDFAYSDEAKPIVSGITRECMGLPLVISTIAYALKSKKSLPAWKYVLHQLDRSNNQEIIFLAIKVSYNLLESEEAKPLFFLCSLVGENGDIDIDYLTGYAMHLGLFEDVYFFEEASAKKKDIYLLEDARKRVHKLVEILKVHGLLLDCESSGTVKMSNSIRFMTQNYISDF